MSISISQQTAIFKKVVEEVRKQGWLEVTPHLTYREWDGLVSIRETGVYDEVCGYAEITKDGEVLIHWIPHYFQ